jgi:HPt (histidine-containing phosphotransfer) domain-containing protein
MSQAVVDANAFAEMKELMGDDFKDIVSMCLQSLPEQLSQIEKAIKTRNVDTLFTISHKMKSSCGSIGAFGLAERAEAIEIISRNGSTQIPEQTLNDLRDATEQVISLLNTELNQKI